MENQDLFTKIITYVSVVLVSANAVLTAIKTICDSVIEKFNKGQNVSEWTVKIAKFVSAVLSFITANTQKK